jgi:hypothetical protein
MANRVQKIVMRILILFLALYFLLLIPDSDPVVPQIIDKSAFTWNSDQYWNELEKKYIQSKELGCDTLSKAIESGLNEFDSLIKILDNENITPDAPLFHSIEKKIFDLSVLIGACPDSLTKFIESFGILRTALKNQSINWDTNDQVVRDRIYRIIYGGRTAVEEIILQSPTIDLPDVIIENDEFASTPSAEILGVKIHSGDILVSRGGAATSALIARGNDYQGNFSHIALVHVDDMSGDVSIIESHIEIGVAVANIDTYFKDKKLRVMVLRPRYDLEALLSDPMLPHKAATYALNRARTENIPYDFAMDTDDPKQLFCSEVAYDAYQQYGIKLWSALSHISSIGVRNWLAEFGVENFTTMEPSDLEYDPQLKVIVEWRDYETLYKDHLDNAVVDVMLESAETGERISYDLYLLPFVRIMKGYSSILNLFDKIGPIPEGMSATSALKNEWFSDRHKITVDKLIKEASEFQEQNGYVPPYWELIKLARKLYK